MRIFYSPRCLDYAVAGHPERPSRLSHIVAALRQEPHDWREPQPCADADITRVHREEHMLAVRTGDFFDSDTPYFANIDEVARLAAGAAIQAAESALDGHPSFALMRPPGHHAERNRVMGFCYFNSLAMAVARVLADRQLARVAVLDFDCHHGNGTENIFLGDNRVQLVSLHQAPCYPGTGLSSYANCRNYPLPPGTGPAPFLAALDAALGELRAFRPQLLAVSAGFDMHAADPLTDMALDHATYGAIGQRIGALGWPTFAVLEGGYADQLGESVRAFVAGWEQRP